MSVAASALIVLCLLTPAMAFRRLYYMGESSKQYTTEDFGRLLLRTVALAAVIQLLAAMAAQWFAPGLTQGYALTLSGVFASQTDLIGEIDAWGHRRAFGWAYVGLIGLSATTGYTCQYVVRRLGLDRKVKLLRFQNYWHYLLRGGIREFSQVGGVLAANQGKLDYTFVQTLATTSEGDMLYDGILVDYELRTGNELEHLVLTGVRRRLLRSDRPHPGASPGGGLRASHKSDPASAERYYLIVGDVIVIPAAQIKNCDLRYINVEEVIPSASNQLEIRVNDADGDVTSAAYFNSPDA